MKRDYSLADIAEFLGAELRGDGSARIAGLNTLEHAGPGELAFLANPKYAGQLSETRAEAVILSADQAAAAPGSCLIMSNPYLGYAKISAWFTTASCQGVGIHPSAVIHANAMVKDDVYIGPNAVVESGAKIESGCSIGANCFIGADSVLGENCQLAANVSIYHDVVLGSRVLVHSGAVIGADGFGFAPNGAELLTQLSYYFSGLAGLLLSTALMRLAILSSWPIRTEFLRHSAVVIRGVTIEE